MAEQKSQQNSGFPAGDFVQLHDLSTNNLNGKIGTISYFDNQSNRYIVNVNDTPMKIKPINLNAFTPYKTINESIGLITTCNIAAGNIIFKEPMTIGFKQNETFELESVITKFNELSNEQQNIYMQLSHHSINQRNDSMDMENEQKQNKNSMIQQIYLNHRIVIENNKNCNYWQGMALHYSLLNHCCIPNAFSFVDQQNGMLLQIVIALKDINKNEEISINYLTANEVTNTEFFSFEQRQNKLLNIWKFKCECVICRKDKQFQMELNAIYAKYNNLQFQIKTNSEMRVRDKIKICLEMIRMLNGKEMRNEPRIVLSKVYIYLAQFYIAIKDWHNSVICINKSIEIDIMYYNQFIVWTDTNFLIKSISEKYMKENAAVQFNDWRHVKGLQIPFINQKQKGKQHRKKKKRRK